MVKPVVAVFAVFAVAIVCWLFPLILGVNNQPGRAGEGHENKSFRNFCCFNVNFDVSFLFLSLFFFHGGFSLVPLVFSRKTTLQTFLASQKRGEQFLSSWEAPPRPKRRPFAFFLVR